MGCQCYAVELSGRRFPTTEERLAELKEYHEWLSQEAKGVEEAMARLQRKE